MFVGVIQMFRYLQVLQIQIIHQIIFFGGKMSQSLQFFPFQFVQFRSDFMIHKLQLLRYLARLYILIKRCKFVFFFFFCFFFFFQV